MGRKPGNQRHQQHQLPDRCQCIGTGQSFQDTLPFDNTATPYIDATGNLYLGDNTGKIYEISSATLPGLLTPGTATLTLAKDFVNKTAIGNYSSVWSGSLSGSNPGEVQYIGGSYYQGKNYLRVQGPNGITIFSQLNGTWSPVWTAYAGGAGIWSSGAHSPRKPPVPIRLSRPCQRGPSFPHPR
jgi:type IV pilus assembly protein PilY1